MDRLRNTEQDANGRIPKLYAGQGNILQSNNGRHKSTNLRYVAEPPNEASLWRVRIRSVTVLCFNMNKLYDFRSDLETQKAIHRAS